MELVVGRVGRPHGVRGEVAVEVRTDQPEERFAPGMVVRASDPGAETAGRDLTVASTRWHGGVLLVAFDELTDRNAAEELRGSLLTADVPEDEQTGDPEEFYDHQLVGLEVRTVTGEPLGEVQEVVHLPMQDLLAVRRFGGGEVLVPFVRAIVPDVRPDEGWIGIDPPAGLIDGE